MPIDALAANMQRHYWRNVHKRAFKDARHALGIETAERVVIGIVIALTALAMVWLVGDNGIAGHALIIRLSFTAAVIILFPFVYGWKFATAPAKMQAEADAKIAQFEQTRARLSVGDPYDVPNSSDAVSWRIKIHNDGASAINVQMNLCDITPRPRSQYWSHDFPYRIVQVGHTLDSNECHIHQGGDGAVFELTKIWQAAHNSGFLTTLNTRIPGGNQVRIEPDEQLQMEYAVTATNADAKKFILLMHANSEGVASIQSISSV